MSSKQKRVQWVDYAKGLSIILVVATHSMFEDIDSVLYSDTIHFFNSIVTRIRMPLFFFISGLFIHKAMSSDLRSFLKFKVSNLLYLFILWSVIRYLTTTVPGHLFFGGTESGLSSILTIFYSPPPTLWFIYAIAIFMVTTRFTKSTPLITFCISILLYLSTTQLGIEGFLKNLVSFYPFFFLGYVLSKVTLRKFDNFSYYHYLMIVVLYFTTVITTVDSLWVQTRPGMLILSFGGIVAGLSIALILTRLPLFSWLGYVGRNTLPIYLMHFFPLGVLTLILPEVIPYRPILAEIIMVISGVALPLLVMIVSKKIGMDWLLTSPLNARNNKLKIEPKKIIA